MRGGLSQKQLAKQRLDLFPPKGRLGAGPARASRGQGGPQGAASSGSCLKGRGKEAGGHPAHSLDLLHANDDSYKCPHFVC